MVSLLKKVRTIFASAYVLRGGFHDLSAFGFVGMRQGGIEDPARLSYSCHNHLLSTSDSLRAIPPYTFSLLAPIGASFLVYTRHAGTIHATECSLASS